MKENISQMVVTKIQIGSQFTFHWWLHVQVCVKNQDQPVDVEGWGLFSNMF